MRTVLVCVALLLLAACTRTPDEQRIRDHIQAMRQAAEAHDPRQFIAFVAADFNGNQGSADREGLHDLLRAIVLRDDKVGVTLGPIDVDVQGDRATASLIATLTGGRGGLLPEQGAVYAIKSGWRRDGKDWICFAATWEQKL